MRLWQTAAFVLMALLLWIDLAAAKTGKSYSSGGSKSYSSGGSKSYSSGGSKSYSSGGSKSYSSGGSKSYSSGGSKSYSSGGSKSYSSGGSKSYSSGGSKSYSGGGSKSYSSGGSKSYSSGGSKSYSGGGSKSYSSKSYSNTSTTPSGKSYSNGGSFSYSRPSIKPGKTSFDSVATKEQTKVESRKLYDRGTTPKPSYNTSSGKTATIDPKDAKINHLRSQLSHERWVNREYRQQQFFGSYYNRPVVVYNDPYPSFFWWWLMDRSLEERALWAYHHRYQMDAARYNAILSKDAQLEAKIRHLEVQNIVRDPNYTPAGIDEDLMYSNEYVDAVYNPAPTSSGWIFVQVLFWIFMFCLAGFVVWFVFFNRRF